jgi:hypothetical protein
MNMPLNRFELVACLAVVALVAPAVGCNGDSLADVKARGSVVTKMREIDAGTGGPGAGGGGGDGWGTLVGRFTFNGTPPGQGNNGAFDKAKDPKCGIDGVKDETLVVDGSSKGIANIVIYVTETDRVHPDILAAPPKEVVFDQKKCQFLQHVSGVSMRDKWVILNSDLTGHNASGAPGRGNPPFNPLLEAEKGRFEYPGFKNPVTTPFEVSCAIHPWMKSYVIARPDPYFAVTGTDGSFKIEKLPAGVELEFQVWHERAPQGLKAKPEWNRGRVKITVPKDGEIALEVPVDPGLLP